jgi:chemotaxis protein MotB
MARRKRHEEPDNHERWVVSYADFITLLFAFFVVMYSISSVNEGKYRVLSDTLTDAFVTAAQSLDPVQVGERVRSMEPMSGEFATPEQEQQPLPPEPVPEEEIPEEEPGVVSSGPAEPPLAAIANRLDNMLKSFVDKELVSVTQTERGIEVEMKSKMLFPSGSARMSRDALIALRAVANIVKPISNTINVEGHTDNVPIRTVTFPSNWELSAARAASVVHLFTRLGVDAKRLSAIGYGEHQPLADNDSEEGRQKNRRVAVVIMAAKHERALMGSESAAPGTDQ